MGIIDSAFVHACQVLTTSQDHRLDFVAGSSAFTVSDTVTGENSKASGVIKSVSVSSGSWGAGTATGHLIIYSVSGTFEDGERITDTEETPGSATTSGTSVPQTNGVGTPITTTVTLPSNSTYYDCLFAHIATAGNSISNTEAGKVIVSSPMVSLPASTIVQAGDLITTNELNWAGTYEVQYVDAAEVLFMGIDHLEAFLKVVKKRV